MGSQRILLQGFVSPCVPTLAAKPPAGPGWVHEIKHDGYRLIVRPDGTDICLRRWLDRSRRSWRRCLAPYRHASCFGELEFSTFDGNRMRRKKRTKVVLGMVTFAFGLLAGAGIAMWWMPPT
jgi:hypothetical protein